MTNGYGKKKDSSQVSSEKKHLKEDHSKVKKAKESDEEGEVRDPERK